VAVCGAGNLWPSSTPLGTPNGKFHDQADAKWIVLRGLAARGLAARGLAARKLAARGLAILRLYLVV
jgi:hypothetical protein